MIDPIDRQDAIDAFKKELTGGESKGNYVTICSAISYEGAKQILESLPSVQPEISLIERKLHGKTPEEQYEFLYWLLFKFAPTYTDSRLAVIEWLRGDLDMTDTPNLNSARTVAENEEEQE